MCKYELTLIALSYLFFIVISESYNPFTQTGAPVKRRRWQLGRMATMASLATGTVVLAIRPNSPSLELAIVLSVLVASLLIAPTLFRKKKNASSSH